eukprot:2368072-Rhodomonas_salina.8
MRCLSSEPGRARQLFAAEHALHPSRPLSPHPPQRSHSPMLPMPTHQDRCVQPTPLACMMLAPR